MDLDYSRNNENVDPQTTALGLLAFRKQEVQSSISRQPFPSPHPNQEVIILSSNHLSDIDSSSQQPLRIALIDLDSITWQLPFPLHAHHGGAIIPPHHPSNHGTTQHLSLIHI